ncbi:MAG TPA: HGxxPAAW family protein [Candidatus Nanopelagicales bacterium]|nr:HGxxPAAW family protein [Candidatus Nanopelagicales bacterium]
MSTETSEHDDHGSTPAAWAAVVIVTIAFAVGTLAVVLGNWPMFWVGVGLVVVGGVVGKVMQAMGLGQKAPVPPSDTLNR